MKKSASQDPYVQIEEGDSTPASSTWMFSQSQLTGLRVLMGFLASVMFITITYTCWTDGSPFQLLIPWMVATLIDFYTNQLVLYLWVFYKEDTASMRIAMLLLMIGLGSLTTTLYVLWQLMKLSPGQGPKDLLLSPSDASRTLAKQ